MNINKSKGFTLIEVMIVVVIIGILSMIGMTNYQEYVIRSQIAEGMTLAASPKTKIVEYYELKGKLPTDNDEVSYNGSSGKYVKEVNINNGVITALFSHTPPQYAHLKIDGVGLELKPDTNINTGSILWSCHLTSSEKYLPTSCK